MEEGHHQDAWEIVWCSEEHTEAYIERLSFWSQLHSFADYVTPWWKSLSPLVAQLDSWKDKGWVPGLLTSGSFVRVIWRSGKSLETLSSQYANGRKVLILHRSGEGTAKGKGPGKGPGEESADLLLGLPPWTLDEPSFGFGVLTSMGACSSRTRSLKVLPLDLWTTVPSPSSQQTPWSQWMRSLRPALQPQLQLSTDLMFIRGLLGALTRELNDSAVTPAASIALIPGPPSRRVRVIKSREVWAVRFYRMDSSIRSAIGSHFK